jgi:hypothetical protein
MAVDGLSINNMGMIRDILPAEIQQRAEESSAALARMKKVENSEKMTLNPDGQNKRDQNQQQQEEEKSQEETLNSLFMEMSEERKSDTVDIYSKVVELTENKSEYKVVYNTYTEIVEIIHIKTGSIKETMTLEELKSFVMKVKNPLGIIVDRKI